MEREKPGRHPGWGNRHVSKAIWNISAPDGFPTKHSHTSDLSKYQMEQQNWPAVLLLNIMRNNKLLLLQVVSFGMLCYATIDNWNSRGQIMWSFRFRKGVWLLFLVQREALEGFKQMSYMMQFILQESHSTTVWREGCSGSRVNGNETRRFYSCQTVRWQWLQPGWLSQ